VTAEFIAHGRQQPVGEIAFEARAEALVKRRRQHIRGDRFFEAAWTVQRPSPESST